MKVFISFANHDHELMHLLSTQLVEYGITPLVAVQRGTPGARLDEKIRAMIAESDAFLVLYTPQAVRSEWVQQEIGCAKTNGRCVVPLKTRETRLTAMLDGIEHYQFSAGNAIEDFRRVASFLRGHAGNMGLRFYLSVQSRYPTLSDQHRGSSYIYTMRCSVPDGGTLTSTCSFVRYVENGFAQNAVRLFHHLLKPLDPEPRTPNPG